MIWKRIESCDSNRIGYCCYVNWQGNGTLHNCCHVVGRDDVGFDDVGRCGMAYDGAAAVADEYDIEGEDAE